MGKVCQKEVENLLRVSEEADQGSVFKFHRKLQAHSVRQIAEIAGDNEIAVIAKKAASKKLHTNEGAAFMAACTPSRISQICKRAIKEMVASREAKVPDAAGAV